MTLLWLRGKCTIWFHQEKCVHPAELESNGKELLNVPKSVCKALKPLGQLDDSRLLMDIPRHSPTNGGMVLRLRTFQLHWTLHLSS
jgi:hypothetical protein